VADSCYCCLYRYALDEFATARRAAVVRCFIDALTRGGPAGTPRPIELHSHDPLRYLGDMLAWLHQAAASEHEHILALLKCCSKISESNVAHLLHNALSCTMYCNRPCLFVCLFVCGFALLRPACSVCITSERLFILLLYLHSSSAFGDVTLGVGRQERHPACKK